MIFRGFRDSRNLGDRLLRFSGASTRIEVVRVSRSAHPAQGKRLGAYPGRDADGDLGPRIWTRQCRDGAHPDFTDPRTTLEARTLSVQLHDRRDSNTAEVFVSLCPKRLRDSARMGAYSVRVRDDHQPWIISPPSAPFGACAATRRDVAVITTTKLKMHTVKDLAEMARKKGVSGWHSMRKDQLIKALLKHAKSDGASFPRAEGPMATANPRRPCWCMATATARRPARQKPPASETGCGKSRRSCPNSKTWLSAATCNGNGQSRDRLVVMVRDPYWLHAYWELRRASIERAKVAMGQHWHGARPVLRVHEITADGTTTSALRRMVRQIEVHGGVNTWYVDVQAPPKDLSAGHRLPVGVRQILWSGPQQRGAYSRVISRRGLRPELDRRGQGLRSNLRHERRLQQ